MTTVFGHFRAHGYRTGALGKLHTPRYLIERDCQFVYDEFIEHPKYLEGAGLYDRNDNRPFAGRRDGECSFLPYEHSCEAALAKQAIRFMRNEGEPKDRGEEDAPWFAWVSFSRPHQPYTPSREYYDAYDPASLQLPPTGEMGNSSGTSEQKLRTELRAYLAVCEQMDHAIGTVLEELTSSGEDRETVIVYSSDHGDYAGEHGSMEKLGGISHRAITRIPMILSVPGMQQRGAGSSAIVESVDLFPTLCDLAGIPTPNTVQGVSFAPVIADPDLQARQNALTENAYRKALATHEWRYVANMDGQPDELYNLREDPWELENRIDDPACSAVAAELLRTLLDRVTRARRPITTINGHWHGHRYDDDGRIDLRNCGPTNEYW